MDRLGGVAGTGSPLSQHPRPLHGPQPRRVQRLDGAGHEPAHAGLRHGHGRLSRRHGARRRIGHLRAGALGAGVHLPAARRVHHERAGGLHRGRLAGTRLRPGRPLPVQRRQVQGGPRGRHGDPSQGHAQRHAGRLRQHRHRLLDAGRPLLRIARRAAEGQLHARRGAAPRSSAPTRTRASSSPSAARSARSASRTPRRTSCAPTSTAIARSSTHAPARTPSASPR